MTRAIDTGTDDLLAEVDGHLGIITFNRPDRRNALSDPMYAGFERALPALAADPDVRVLVVTGAGGAFCAGGDVKGMNEAHRTGTSRPGRGVASRIRSPVFVDRSAPCRWRCTSSRNPWSPSSLAQQPAPGSRLPSPPTYAWRQSEH